MRWPGLLLCLSNWASVIQGHLYWWGVRLEGHLSATRGYFTSSTWFLPWWVLMWIFRLILHIKSLFDQELLSIVYLYLSMGLAWAIFLVLLLSSYKIIHRFLGSVSLIQISQHLLARCFLLRLRFWVTLIGLAGMRLHIFLLWTNDDISRVLLG